MKFTLRKKEERLVMKKTIHAFETKKAKLSEMIISMQTPHPGQIWGIGQQAKTRQGAYKLCTSYSGDSLNWPSPHQMRIMQDIHVMWKVKRRDINNFVLIRQKNCLRMQVNQMDCKWLPKVCKWTPFLLKCLFKSIK